MSLKFGFPVWEWGWGCGRESIEDAIAFSAELCSIGNGCGGMMLREIGFPRRLQRERQQKELARARVQRLAERLREAGIDPESV